MEVVTRPTDDDFPNLVRTSFSTTSELQLNEKDSESKPLGQYCDYEGNATLSGSRVEAILFCPDRGSRILTSRISFFHPRVRH